MLLLTGDRAAPDRLPDLPETDIEGVVLTGVKG